MIYGHGIDIADVTRFMEMDDNKIIKLAERILTNVELEIFNSLRYSRKILYLTKIWSAKEAISKAFKTGIRDEVVWQNIEIVNDQLGAPEVRFKNELNTHNFVCNLSISHEGNFIMSSAILEINNAH
jgi:holo-[acyl-carrier protein] synthase